VGLNPSQPVPIQSLPGFDNDQVEGRGFESRSGQFFDIFNADFFPD